MRPGKNGGKLRTGNPGNKGGGRSPEEFKALCRNLASGKVTVESVKAILGESTHTQFVAALRWATENGYGKPAERHEVTGADGGPVEVRQQIVIGGQTITF